MPSLHSAGSYNVHSGPGMTPTPGHSSSLTGLVSRAILLETDRRRLGEANSDCGSREEMPLGAKD